MKSSDSGSLGGGSTSASVSSTKILSNVCPSAVQTPEGSTAGNSSAISLLGSGGGSGRASAGGGAGAGGSTSSPNSAANRRQWSLESGPDDLLMSSPSC